MAKQGVYRVSDRFTRLGLECPNVINHWDGVSRDERVGVANTWVDEMLEIDGRKAVLIGYSDAVKHKNAAGYNFREANLEAFEQGRRLITSIAHDRWDGKNDVDRKIDTDRPVRFFEVLQVKEVEAPSEQRRHRNKTRAAILGKEYGTFEDLRLAVFEASPTAREDAADLESAMTKVVPALRDVPEASPEEYEREAAIRNLPDPDRFCNVYLFIEPLSRAFKVGFSADPDARRSNLQVGNPREIEYVGALPKMIARKALAVEQEIHISLRDGHIRGEWFDETVLTQAFDLFEIGDKLRKEYRG
jgi:hypothetical protein